MRGCGGKGEKKMNCQIDVKSAVVGGLLVLVCLCLFGFVPNMPPEYYRRFQLEAGNGHAFVLDSATGQVWGLCALENTCGSGEDPNSFYAIKVQTQP
jgi:hypothetical protein